MTAGLEFKTTTAYTAGQVVSYLGTRYSANRDFTSAGAFSGADWTEAGPATVSSVDGVKGVVSSRAGRERLWGPTGALENMPRIGTLLSNQALLTSGRLFIVGGLVIPAGRTVTSLTFVSGATAAVTPTHQWFCLVAPGADPRTVLAKTVDDTSTAWAANAAKTLALSATYTPTAETSAYVGIMVAAGTCPTLWAMGGAGTAVAALSPIICGATPQTGLTDPASLSAGVGDPTPVDVLPYCYAL